MGHVAGSGTRGPRRMHGVAAVETALSIAVLVGVLAALMGVIQNLQGKDQAERATRAGARSVALLESAPTDQASLESAVCEGVNAELQLDEGYDCTEGWSIEVEAYASPSALLAGTKRDGSAPLGGEDGDLVLVRLTERERPAKTEEEKRKMGTGRRTVAIAQNERSAGA